MLKIKLARFGKNQQPYYRIVINEAKDKRDGQYVESIGRYAPSLTPKILEIDVKKFEEWLKKGAQPTDTVAALFIRFNSGNPFPPKKAVLSKKAKAKLAAAKAEKEADAAKPVEAAKPAEEAPAPAIAEEAKPEVATEAAAS